MFFLRCDKQMDMVGHQNVGVNFATMRCASQLQFFKVEEVIGIRAKNLAAVIASHNHMLRLIGDNESR
jgi:hypothetical protein